MAGIMINAAGVNSQPRSYSCAKFDACVCPISVAYLNCDFAVRSLRRWPSRISTGIVARWWLARLRRFSRRLPHVRQHGYRWVPFDSYSQSVEVRHCHIGRLPCADTRHYHRSVVWGTSL